MDEFKSTGNNLYDDFREIEYKINEIIKEINKLKQKG